MTTPTSQAARAWPVWLVGLGIYFLAVLHRSSMAVAGLEASERFGISAAALGTFVLVQLALYTGMQIPVGLLLDRFGSRRLLFCGLVILSTAQVVFALTESYPVAVACRVLVGIGDALIFISVLRLVAAWFSATRVPLVTQLTGSLGQAGALAAAVPMTWSFQYLGWTTTYLILAGAGVVAVLALLFVVHDNPGTRAQRGPAMSLTTVRRNLAAAWEQPGTRLGFWTHFTTQFSATAMTLLWGYPYLVRAQGLDSVEAGLLLTIMICATIASGPVLGTLIGRFPYQRSTVVLTIIAVIVAVWTLVLAWPGPAPVWLLVVLMVVVGIGAPASLIGFDFGRTSNPRDRLGSVNGVINQGGFLASLILVVAIGLILDWRTPTGAEYTPESFVWAMSFQYVLWGVGGFQIWRYRRKTRAWVAGGHGPGLYPPD